MIRKAKLQRLPELLEMADDKKLPFNTAVEISYLRNEEQQVLLQYMSNHNMEIGRAHV